MPKAKVVERFKYAVGGIRLIDVEVGEVIEDDCAIQALSRGWAVELEDEKAKPAPENKAVHAAPRNKGKG